MWKSRKGYTANMSSLLTMRLESEKRVEHLVGSCDSEGVGFWTRAFFMIRTSCTAYWTLISCLYYLRRWRLVKAVYWMDSISIDWIRWCGCVFLSADVSMFLKFCLVGVLDRAR